MVINMCNYVLNDVGYDNAPLEIIDPKRVEHIDEKKLSESITKNKKIIEQMPTLVNIFFPSPAFASLMP